MEAGDVFFLIFALTILSVRVLLWLKPMPSPTIYGVRLHHWMYGLAMLPIAVAIQSLPLFALALGLFVDELPFLLIGGKTHEDNYSRTSLVGILVLILLVFACRHWIALLFT